MEIMLRLLVERYFHLGFKNQVILDFLKNCHGIPISLSTLKRRLRDYGLKRRGGQIEDQELRERSLREISGPGQIRGYRAVWYSLRLKHRIHELVQGTNSCHQHASRNWVRN